MIEDLSGTVLELATDSGEEDGLYRVERGAPPVETDGRVRPAAPLAVDRIPASVQPLDKQGIESLDAGERVDDWRLVVATVPLHLADTATGRVADVIIIDGARFEVRELDGWLRDFGFVKARVRKSDR